MAENKDRRSRTANRARSSRKTGSPKPSADTDGPSVTSELSRGRPGARGHCRALGTRTTPKEIVRRPSQRARQTRLPMLGYRPRRSWQEKRHRRHPLPQRPPRMMAQRLERRATQPRGQHRSRRLLSPREKWGHRGAKTATVPARRYLVPDLQQRYQQRYQRKYRQLAQRKYERMCPRWSRSWPPERRELQGVPCPRNGNGTLLARHSAPWTPLTEDPTNIRIQSTGTTTSLKMRAAAQKDARFPEQ